MDFFFRKFPQIALFFQTLKIDLRLKKEREINFIIYVYKSINFIQKANKII